MHGPCPPRTGAFLSTGTRPPTDAPPLVALACGHVNPEKRFDPYDFLENSFVCCVCSGFFFSFFLFRVTASASEELVSELPPCAVLFRSSAPLPA